MSDRYANSGKFTAGHRRSAKLTPSEVIEIRRLYSEEGWTQGRLARHFQMSIGQIGRIVRGEQWQNYAQIPDDQTIEQRMLENPPSAEKVEESQQALLEKLASSVPEPSAADPISQLVTGDPLGEWRKRRADAQENSQSSAPAAGGDDGKSKSESEV